MKSRNKEVSLSASRAFQLVLEDSLTSFFIITSFHHPESNSRICSNKWISQRGNSYTWNVEIIEKFFFPLSRSKEMLNIVLVEIDAQSGKITKRQFLRNILEWEYRKYVRGLNNKQ